ncbi:MAG TPA: CHRD domain-containing protein [Gemmatimonadales bacterium]|nr:CHRD domain-containing protein [Gemmatimonadales bacterium]
MRHWRTFLAALIAIGCGDRTPSSAISGNVSLLANLQSEQAPPLVFNAQMRSELEVPTCVSESKGHAQIKILQDGTIEAAAKINNLGGESIRFGHIHHLTPGQGAGPIIWWLTSPVGVDLNITDRQLDVRQDGIFVANPHFATADLALAELLNDPGSFYVNFHSDLCPGGFARGFLP